ncbi:MAG: hypothetical protein QXS54_09500 [Candidatus Methanomethylicaceae archaeon]
MAQRYRNLVKAVDCGEISPQDFVRCLFPNCYWHEVWAAVRIYLEDGGKMSKDEFLSSIASADNPPEGLEIEEFLNSPV